MNKSITELCFLCYNLDNDTIAVGEMGGYEKRKTF